MKLTDWLQEDPTPHVACPVDTCAAPAGTACFNPWGDPRLTPHLGRSIRLTANRWEWLFKLPPDQRHRFVKGGCREIVRIDDDLTDAEEL